MPITGLAGDLARGAPLSQDGSYVADGDIPFGSVVEQSPNGDRLCRKFSGSGQAILGIAFRDPSKTLQRDATTGQMTESLSYKDGQAVTVLQVGIPLVPVVAHVHAGKRVYVLTADGDDVLTGDIVDEDSLGGIFAYMDFGDDDSAWKFQAKTVGSQGNLISLSAVQASGASAPLSVNAAGQDITITLGTDAGDKANDSQGSGNSQLFLAANSPGPDGNLFSWRAVNGSGSDDALAVEIVGKDVLITLGTLAVVAAHVTVGSGDAALTTTFNTVGTGGNAKTIAAVAGSGVDVPVSASYIGNALVVTLGTDGAGVADPTKNTATLVAAQIVTDVGTYFTAAAGGNGSGVVAPFNATSLAGGISAGTPSNAKNTASQVEAALNNDPQVSANVNADHGGNGTGVVAAFSKSILSGGSNPGLDDSKNTAALIVEALLAEPQIVALGSASLLSNGEGSLTETFENVYLEGGEDVTAEMIPNARFRTSVTAGNLAEAQFNLPG